MAVYYIYVHTAKCVYGSIMVFRLNYMYFGWVADVNNIPH